MKIMHEKTNQKQKLVKIKKTRFFFPRVIFPTRIITVPSLIETICEL